MMGNNLRKCERFIFVKYIFFLLFLGIIMYMFKYDAYIQRVYLILSIIAAIAAFSRKKMVSQTDLLYVFMEIGYFVVVVCSFCLLSGKNIREAFQNVIPLLIFCLLYLGLKSNSELLTISVCVEKYIVVTMIASILNIIMTIRSIVRGEIQEGYRILLIGIIIGVYVMVLYKRYNSDYKIAVPLLLAILSIIVSYSKQAYLSLALVGVLLICTIKNTEKMLKAIGKVVLLFLVGMLLLLVVAKYNNRVNTIVNVALYNYRILTDWNRLLGQETYRMTEIKNALVAFKEAPFFGIGSGEKYTTFGLQSWVHNNWIWFLLDFGIIGFMIYFIPMFIKLCKAWREGWRYRHVDYKKALSRFIPAGAVIILFFNALFSPIFFRAPMDICIWALYMSLLDVEKSEGVC